MNQQKSDHEMRDVQNKDVSSYEKAQQYKELLGKCLQQLKALKIPYQ